MKWMLMIGLFLSSYSTTEWQTDFETAKKIASDKDRYILLNFSGSDWCIPCIRLRKSVFDSDSFGAFADSSLVLLNADFPRSRKNQLPKEQQEKNERLADKYNPSGVFPLTLLLTADGKVLHRWEGLPPGDASRFINDIKAARDANNR